LMRKDSQGQKPQTATNTDGSKKAAQVLRRAAALTWSYLGCLVAFVRSPWQMLC
jgi:hypothetical protein